MMQSGVQPLRARPHQKEPVAINVALPADLAACIYTLEIKSAASELQLTEAVRLPEGVRVRVRGKYTRNDGPNQFIIGEHTMLISNRGDIEVS